jgi:hypothetical protein
MVLTLINNTSTISFCDRECINITSNHFKKELFNKLHSNYNINPVSNSIYVRLDCNKMKNITLHTHILATLTNGNPYMLYFTIIDNKNVVIFIDRKKKENHSFPKIHVITYNFNDTEISIFNETIMSGELVRDINKNWFLLLDNIYLYNGKNLVNNNIISRFELLHTILKDNYQPSPSDICPLQIKRLFTYKETAFIFKDYMPKLSYVCKGLVFYTMNPKCTNFSFELPRDEQIPIISNEDVEKEILKKQTNYKTISSNSDDVEYLQILPQISTSNNSDICDISDAELLEIKDEKEVKEVKDEIKPYSVFKVLKTDKPDIYQLYSMEKKQLKLHSIALIPNIKISKMMNSLFKFKESQLDCKMRCVYSKIFKRWIPKEITSETVNTNLQIIRIINNLDL